MAPQTYPCKDCPIHGGNHRPRRRQRQTHQAAIAELRENMAMEDVIDDLDVLNNLFTGLIVTDDGPSIRGQQESRLFSSSGDFEVALPDAQPISNEDALASLQAVAAAAPTASSTPVRTAPPTRKERRRNTLTDVLGRIRTAHSTLDDIYGLCADTSDYTVARLGLDAAAETVVVAGKLLRSIEAAKRDAELATLWDDVYAEAVALDKLVDCVGAIVPKADVEMDNVEREYDTAHHFEDPIAGHDTIAQLVILVAVISNVVVGLATNPCNFLIDAVTMIIKATMASSSPSGAEHTAKQRDILSQLPTTLEDALKMFKLEPKTRILATCSSCHHTHEPEVNRLTGEPTYPTHCVNLVFRGKRKNTPAVPCHTPLLEKRQGKLRPIKPFVYPDFTDHMASILSDPEVAAMCNSACDTAWQAVQASLAADPHGPVSEAEVNNIFEAEFLRTFEGPVPQQLFINREGRMRLAFQILLDFFNPHGMRKRGNHDSIGILAVVNLNLPEDIRYKAEYMWLSIILGPNEPNHDQIPSYLRPLIDEFVAGWKPGIHLSRTGLSDAGTSVDIAIAVNVNDLPATRKMLGLAGVGSNHICTICDCTGVANTHRTDLDNPAWARRDVGELRRRAYEWKNAKTQGERDRLFEEHGVRWSELWRLPYWDPTRMGVVDSMHCILEGLVHYHCRRVLRIDAEVAKKKEKKGIAFEHDWVEYDPQKCSPQCLLRDPGKDLPVVYKIQAKLVESLLDEDENEEDEDGDVAMLDAPEDDVPATSEADMLHWLSNSRLDSLRYVAGSLGLDLSGGITRAHYARRLMASRLTKPRSGSLIPRAISLQQLHFIQRVISKTTTPSWIHTVPHNYGESNAGSIKADEWRTLSTLYLPLALVLLWLDRPHDEKSARFLGMLDHSMALFQSVLLVCRCTMTSARAAAYRTFLKIWVDGLTVHYPHTRNHAKRPNIHVAFHIYDFLLLFGPVISWWCFPFERMIGCLQKINTTNRIGGELEGILTTSFLRAATLRRWLRRPDCPQVIKQFKAIFDRAFTPRSEAVGTSPPLVKDGDRAQYMFDGISFSRASAHLGNSLVLYYPSTSASTPIPGSIERIVSAGEHTSFIIRRQAVLPPGKFDPFSRYYPHFPAKTYSSEMQNITDTVTPSMILSHYARLEFSQDRAVVVNLSRS